MMAFLLTLASFSAYQTFSLSSVSDQGRMAAEMVRISLTEEMVQGVVDHRTNLLSRLKYVPGVENIRIVRGKAVVDQFGPGFEGESQYDEIEKQVLITGEAVEKLNEGARIIFQTTIPYIASLAGSVNCMKCHKVSEGDVLGAVSLSIDLTEQRAEDIRSIATVVALLLLFSVALALFLSRLLSPVVRTTVELKSVVENAEAGIFSGRLKKMSNDEIGEIADRTNHLMHYLDESIGTMSQEIESLTEYTTLSDDENKMKQSLSAVQTMVDASRFKRAIENDRNLAEVYARIRRVFRETFNLQRFSMYEMNNEKKRLLCIFADGLPEASELWCDREVLLNADACRACRSVHMVKSSKDPKHCPSFAGNRIQQDAEFRYICLPIMLSGAVGGVLQLVISANEEAQVEAALPAIRIYLGEAAPVIETKRLLNSLKESAMRDAMTGLYNRRFLEEYIDMVSSIVERKSSNAAILMCDVDYFKKINDTYGHEAGDTVLIEVAKTLKQAVRPSDLVIRYGGEEFLTLLVDIDEKMALEVAERIRKGVEARAFRASGGKINKTISIGASMFPKDGGVFWDCVKYADAALYHAKDSGRNQVVRYSPEMSVDEME